MPTNKPFLNFLINIKPNSVFCIFGSHLWDSALFHSIK
jgi:hypothetical protein